MHTALASEFDRLSDSLRSTYDQELDARRKEAASLINDLPFIPLDC